MNKMAGDGPSRDNRPHRIVVQSADAMREALQLHSCCANHAADIALLTAISFVADIAGDDRAEMQRIILELSKHWLRQIESGEVTFTRRVSN